MAKFFGFRAVLFAGALLSVLGGQGFCQAKEVNWLVSKGQLESQKLEIAWQTELPIEAAEKIDHLSLIGGRAYVFTNKNYIFSLNRMTGSIVFSQVLAMEDLPVMGLDAYGKELYSVIGNDLVEMDIDTGVRKSETSFDYGVTCPAARNGAYYYVAGSDKRIHILDEKTKVQLREISAYDYSTITSLIATDSYVIFGTDSGRVTQMEPFNPTRIWKFDASGGVVGPLVKDGGNLFLASKDTKVYKLNLGGEYKWKYLSGEVLDAAPVVSGTMVYQYVNGKGLAAIDKESGKEVWQIAKGIGVLAEFEGKAYVLTSDKKMVIMNNKKAKQEAELDFSEVTKFTSNMADRKMYVADDMGRFTCIQPKVKEEPKVLNIEDANK